MVPPAVALAPALTADDEKQLELLRAASPQRRFALARSLSAQTLALTHRAIERANAHLDAWQRRVLFVEVQYGAELAAHYRRWLVARGHLPA
jgi:hypothetical protein